MLDVTTEGTVITEDLEAEPSPVPDQAEASLCDGNFPFLRAPLCPSVVNFLSGKL